MTAPSAPRLTSVEASAYEELFVPALFGPWAERVAAAARIQNGDRVLDVACGTGVLARAAAKKAGPQGKVVGLDLSEGMLDVAARMAPAIEWRRGLAESLPFQDETFDAVVSQFGLMFFADRRRALEEMHRVLKRGGHMAVAVWDALDRIPAYAAFVALLKKLFGDEVANALRAPFSMGDRQRLGALFAEAGVSTFTISTREGSARFPSLETWVAADARGWLGLDDEKHGRLLEAARTALASFVATDGSVVFSLPAHIITTTRPRSEPASV